MTDETKDGMTDEGRPDIPVIDPPDPEPEEEE